MMNEGIARRPAASSAGRSMWFRAGAIAALAAAAGVILYLSLRGSNNNSSGSQTTLNATAVSVAQLQQLAQSVGHPIYWVGQKPGVTYELSRLSNGNIILRYLPAGTSVGSTNAFLTVATYPFSDAYAALAGLGGQPGSTQVKLANGGIAIVSSAQPDNVHAAFPSVNYQAEIYDPAAGRAEALVAAGKLGTIGTAAATTATAIKPTAVTRAKLVALAGSVQHPVFWAGQQFRKTYELTESSSGNIFVRYLPKGAALGSSKPYMTVATYPFQGAYPALLALANQKGSDSFKLKNGGLALVDPRDPGSIHVAYPNVNYQVEVFDPVASVTRKLVESGRIVGLG